jgi:phage terminase large subunit-like protein
MQFKDVNFKWKEYMNGVLAGDVVACDYVIRACNRQKQDLETGHERGLVFDENAANWPIYFISQCKHSKGEWAGQYIVLEPWQQFIIACIFGWKRNQSDIWLMETPNGVEDTRGTRRFKTAYLEIARKNGKSTLAAGVGLYLFAADFEEGAEVYTAATKKDQAKITHKEAVRMVKRSEWLQAPIHKKGYNIKAFVDNLHIPDTASKFEPLGADSDTMDGLNVSGAIIDEIHAHKTRAVWDVLDTATGSRRNPLLFGITTAGQNKTSLCYDLHRYTEQILTGVIEDDAHFGIIYGLDKIENEQGDLVLEDWEDESKWIKANPNLGVSKKWDDMRRKATKAKNMPSALSAFLRLELDAWVQGADKWMNPDKWAQCGQGVDPKGLMGRLCYGGLDLSSNVDITAWCLSFPPDVESDPYQILIRFFMPQNNIAERVKVDKVPYDAWVRQGYITPTPGDVIDYDYIFDQIKEDMQTFDLSQIAFDRWGSRDIVQRIQKLNDADEFLVEFGQGFRDMAPAVKDLEDKILTKAIAHGSNPVLNWMVDNTVMRQDPAGNRKPDKKSSPEKIDGVVALLMSISRAIVNEGSKKSVYDKRGLRRL